MNDFANYFITWTTYGTWLPGDCRGWRKTNQGNQSPRPLLAEWCRQQMTGNAIILNRFQRRKVEATCREHAKIRGWTLLAVNARSNHVQLLVTADKAPQIVRDQFKANATRVLRQNPDAMTNAKVWTRGGDCEIIEGDDNLERVFQYITEAQDRKERDK